MEEDFDPIMGREKTGVMENLFTKVFGWMFTGLLITAMVAYMTANSEVILRLIFSSGIIFYGLIIAEVALVWFFSAKAMKMSYGAAIASYLIYAVINGLTLSVIFLAYDLGIVYAAFGATSFTFGAMAVYGCLTKKDLSNVGSVAIMALFGLIIASIVNIFIASNVFDWIIIYAGIVIFVALTAYDIQRIKRMAEAGVNNRNIAIVGALTLYLDFINLFLKILRAMGKRRR